MTSLDIQREFCKLWDNIHALAPARFESYADEADGDEMSTIAKYCWNLDLCAALYIPLHYLEVGLRSNAHNALTSYYGDERWFENADLIPPDSKTGNNIREIIATIQKAGRDATPDRIVAGLSFGFWTALFALYRKQLYRPVAYKIFPGLHPKDRSEKHLFPRLEDARKLRNRVFHHEPIWRNKNLKSRHENVVALAESICPDLKIMISCRSNFAVTADRGWEGALEEMKELCTELSGLHVPQPSQ